LKEVLYAAEKNFLERYLKEKSAATIADIQAITDLWDKSIALPGTPEAVDKIYSLDGDAAHIRIEGLLSPEGPDIWDLFRGYGGVSYWDIVNALGRAKNDPRAKSVILDINSPGGSVDGVDQTWQAVRTVGKPVTTHAGGLLASAAYWIASGTDAIYAEDPTSEIGSIGVLVAAYDWSKWEENIGIREIIITSSNAPDKAPDPATKHGRETLLSQLNALERIFYARVSEGRGVTAEHIAEHFGRGGLLVAADPSPDHEDAIRAGMIDGLTVDGYFNDVRNSVAASMGVPASIFAFNPSSKGNHTPAQAGNREDKAMTLSEFLAQNPSALSDLDRIKAEAKGAGRDEALAEQSARISRVMGVITSEAYPANIKALAGDVLAGKKGIDAFDAAVAVYDSELERRKGETAQAETAAGGALGADGPGAKSAEELAMEAAAQEDIGKAKARNEGAAKWL
jgi:ClpP class serine protease